MLLSLLRQRFHAAFVCFIIHHDLRNVTCFQFLQSIGSDLHLLSVIFIGKIHHLDQQICVFYLFQGRAECLYQTVGQLMNESNRIRQEKRLIMPRIYTADAGLQCGEQHIFFHDRFLREFSKLLHHTVQDRGLSRIGIAHQRYLRSPGLLSFPALHIPCPADIFQLLFQFRDPVFDLTSVQLQLFLTGTLVTHAAAGAALTAQCIVHTYQSRKHILQSCCLHLQFGFSGLCPYGKYVKDQVCTVNDGKLQLFPQISHLRRRQGIVEYDLLCTSLLRQSAYLIHLARSDIQCFVHMVQPLYDLTHDFLLRGFCQTCQLFHGMLKIRFLPNVHTD